MLAGAKVTNTCMLTRSMKADVVRCEIEVRDIAFMEVIQAKELVYLSFGT